MLYPYGYNANGSSFLYAGKIEGGGVFFFGGGEILHIPFGDAPLFHIIAGADPFPLIQTAVEVGVIELAVGGILAHEGKEDLTVGEGVGDPVDHGAGVFLLTGQDEVANENAGAEQTIFQHVVPRLPIHFQNSGLRRLGIVGAWARVFARVGSANL